MYASRSFPLPGGTSALYAMTGLGVNQADADSIDARGDRGVHRGDHLPDIAGLRAGPLVFGVEDRAHVLDPVLRRDEEWVRRDVVDEDPLPLGRLREVADAAAGAVAAAATGGKQCWERECGTARPDDGEQFLAVHPGRDFRLGEILNQRRELVELRLQILLPVHPAPP